MTYEELFDYDGERGCLLWKRRPESAFQSLRAARRWNVMYPGKVAGWRAIEKGGKPAFVLVSIYAKSILVHRIIWEMHNGTIPAGMQIDHIDMDVFNNRIENLRLATTSQNKANNKKYANNTSGFKGVSRDRTRWKAVIGYGGKRIRLGHYSTPEEAHMAYCVAAKKFQGEFARLS